MIQTPFSHARQLLSFDNQDYIYCSLSSLKEWIECPYDMEQLPVSLKILLEGLLRHPTVATDHHLRTLLAWGEKRTGGGEIPFFPARVLMQDKAGIPALVDLAAMRDICQEWGQDAQWVHPQIPVDLVMEPSTTSPQQDAFLKWGGQTFHNLHVFPPDGRLCHQAHIASLTQGIHISSEGVISPDTVVGTDPQTTLVNGLGVLGWDVGGLVGTSTLLGNPLNLILPPVFGICLEGTLPENLSVVDLITILDEQLQSHDLTHQFVEFWGTGLASLTLSDRLTLVHHIVQRGATCALFPFDDITLDSLRLFGHKHLDLLTAYAKAQGLWISGQKPLFSQHINLDLQLIHPVDQPLPLDLPAFFQEPLSISQTWEQIEAPSGDFYDWRPPLQRPLYLRDISTENPLLQDMKGIPILTIFEDDITADQIFDASQEYSETQQSLVVIAGKNCGAGPSFGLAVRSLKILGVKAIIAESFSQAYRSNLVGMGILPLQLLQGLGRHHLNLTGNEVIDILGITSDWDGHQLLTIQIHQDSSSFTLFPVKACFETHQELIFYKNGGILPAALRSHYHSDEGASET